MKVSAPQARILAALWIGLLLLPSVVWIGLDRRAWAWDPGYYGYWVLKLLNTLSTEGVAGWLSANIRALGMMPPLLVWLAQPFTVLRHVVGEIDIAFMMLNVTAVAGTLAVIYVIVRRLGGSLLDALAAVTICGAANLFLGVSRHFLTEPLQGLTAVLSVFVALHAERRAPLRNVGLVLLMLGASFLAKATSFIFVLPALTYIAVVLLAARGTPHPPARRSDVILVIAGMFVCGVTAAWYVLNWEPMTMHFVQASIGPEVQNYRSATPYLHELMYWVDALSEALSMKPVLPALLAIVIVAALGLAVARLRTADNLVRHAIANGALFGYYLAGMIVLTIISYAVQINHDPRFAYVLIPLIAVLAGWACATLRRGLVAATLLALFTASGAAAHALTFGVNIGDSAAWLWPIDRNPSDRADLERVIAASCRGDKYANALGVSTAGLNPNNANYYAERQRLETGVGCLYHMPPIDDVDKALAWLDAAGIRYFVTIAPALQEPVTFANPIAPALAERLESDPDFALQPSATDRLRIYRRAIGPGSEPDAER